MSNESEAERDYYRAVEDLFATLRGFPHTLSPKDFQLLREWWRDEIPLPAIRSAITEVFARRRERGEQDPVVSLGYCRHAVRSHAKRAAEMQVGAHDDDGSAIPDPKARLDDLSTGLSNAADGQRSAAPRIADIIARFAATVAAARDLPSSTLEEHLFALESALLANCLKGLDDQRRRKIEDRAHREAEATSATPEARERAFRALRDRMLREELELPRLELDG